MGFLVEDLLEADQMCLHAVQLPRDPRRLLVVLGGRIRLLVGVVALAFRARLSTLNVPTLTSMSGPLPSWVVDILGPSASPSRHRADLH